MVTLKGCRAEPLCPIWTISDLYFPIDGYYDRSKCCADHFSRSGGVRANKKPECSIGASLAQLNKSMINKTHLVLLFSALVRYKS